jgi:hypothetical protein
MSSSSQVLVLRLITARLVRTLVLAALAPPLPSPRRDVDQSFLFHGRFSHGTSISAGCRDVTGRVFPESLARPISSRPLLMLVNWTF